MLKECMYDVTDAQVGQAYKCFEGKNPFYMVVNSKNETDENGHIIEYKVRARYDVELKQWVFTCTCKSGEHNFKNVRHPSHVCWHVRAALACAKEEKKALKEMAAQIDAEKQQPTEDTRPVATSLVQVALGEPGQYRIPTWDDVKPAESATTSEDVVTEVVAEPVASVATPVTPTERAIVATEVARDLRAKTATRAATWNNSHQSTLTEREKWIYTAKPAAHMKKTEPVVKGSLYSKPFNFYR